MRAMGKPNYAQLVGFGVGLCLTACSNEPIAPTAQSVAASERLKGIHPDIVVGEVSPKDADALSQWIEEAVALFQSPKFETNFMRASSLFPEVYVSKSQDIILTSLLLQRLKTDDPYLSALWWPKTYVVLNGETAVRSENRRGFGFEALRNAGAGPFPVGEIGTATGEIELGRLHFARYTQGDTVEKSCAMNTMVHEISHTLSDRPDIFWMHVLDTEEDVTPPRGIFEASYFVGIIAQCTYLEDVGRIDPSGFEACIRTFSDPASASRFRSIACDDFPDGTAIRPENRIIQ